MPSGTSSSDAIFFRRLRSVGCVILREMPPPRAVFGFLDGWKSAYLPVFQILRPRLRPGALILADNIVHDGAADYLAAVRAPASGCETTVRGSLAITCLLP